MGWFDSEQGDAYGQLSNFEAGSEVTEEHKAKFTHEFIGGAAAYEAMKAYEEHQAKNGKPESHAQAKEILAGLAGAFIDREVETKGLDFVDRERAKRHARQQLEEASAQDF
uniref:CipC n=1 Tax=Aspergillus carbonarius TaxID=40993 RepID=M4QW57_ASPCA|nr:CipC [Aspergillus carbonarius]